METKRQYIKDTYKFSGSAQICAVESDAQGHYILLNQTIFYPQGGGQPSDQGTMVTGERVIPIHQVKCIDNEIRHYTDQAYNHLIGQKVECFISTETRLLHSRLHTAGHLISTVIEKLQPQWIAQKGHHFPNECFVEFITREQNHTICSLETINQEINRCINENYPIETLEIAHNKLSQFCPNLSYTIPNKSAIRIMRIGEFPYQLCGGTHVKSLFELKGLEVIKFKIKGNILKIYYDIKP